MADIIYDTQESDFKASKRKSLLLTQRDIRINTLFEQVNNLRWLLKKITFILLISVILNICLISYIWIY